jgi:hypothetical protein
MINYTCGANMYYMQFNLAAGDPIVDFNNIPLICPCTIAITASNNVQSNGTISLDVTSGDSYIWSGPNGYSSTLKNPSILNATSSMSGIYSVSVVYAGQTCTSTTSVYVYVCPAPIRYCSGSVIQVDLTAAGGYATYQWYRNGVLIVGGTSQVYSATSIGSYSFQVTGGGGSGTCGNQSCCPIIIRDDLVPVCLDVTSNRVR